MEQRDTLKYEREYIAQGYRLVAGIDEAGRGPLAGPVVAACAIMDMDNIIDGIGDSKKISPKKRAKLYEIIKTNAICYGIGIVDVATIEEINILNAAKLAMKIAYEDMEQKADFVLVDAIDHLDIDAPIVGIIRGDELSYTIGAASILAKETRDSIMVEYDSMYPEYGFAKHKGYGTKMHTTAIRVHGACSIHRPKFLRKILAKR